MSDGPNLSPDPTAVPGEGSQEKCPVKEKESLKNPPGANSSPPRNDSETNDSNSFIAPGSPMGAESAEQEQVNL